MQDGTPTPPLILRLFGPFEAHVHGAPLPRLRSRKGRWLLALRAGREIERGWLVATLWPDSPEAAGFANLRSSLKDLRRALCPEAARLGSPTSRSLCLELGGAEVDVLAFDAAIARADPASLEEALGLYRGPLLEGCAEEWAFQERQLREQAYLTALETLAGCAQAAGDPEAAERYLRRTVAVDPLRESAQRALMQALATGGNYAAAMLVYRELRLRLHREVNAEPDAETQALFQQLRAEGRRRAAAVGPASVTSGPEPAAPLPSLLLPEGTVTFLFTDIEGSTRVWEQHPEAMGQALARHSALLRHAIKAHGGHVFKTMGDEFCAAFGTAPEALAAAVAAQRALQAEDWGQVAPLRVRMALHTGAVEQREGDYFGPPLSRVARLLDAGHGGQVLLSQAASDLVRDALPEAASLRDLGTHRLKELKQPESLFQLVHADLQANNFPPLRSLEAFAHNLPRQLTSFIGREKEMAEVRQLLSTTALLTLTGAGGCGKTRLALQVAADVLEEYADGAWLVELAPLANPALVPQSAASALGVREEPGRPLAATLSDYLRPKSLLLVLDNCEHLLAACAQLADALLRGCPELRILASSREGLGIAGERTYRVPSLSLPDPRHLPPVERLTDYEAVRLFSERAVFTQPGFAVSDQNALAVAQVCRRLDGIPLAIELAAARVRALPVDQINARLDDMFRLLIGGSRTALPRQQTLRALIDWSYDLLSEGEQTLLRRLSVFAGGWTLGGAEAVCAGESVEAWEVLDLLTALVDKSLVAYEEQGGEGRYRLLETVRQYARDRLLEAGEAEATRGRHLECFVQLAEQAELEFAGPQQVAWLDRLEREHDNLRAALVWCRSEGRSQKAAGSHDQSVDAPGSALPDRPLPTAGWPLPSRPEAGLRLGGAVWWFWGVRGYEAEGREHLAGLLALPGAQARTAARAKALRCVGSSWITRQDGKYGGARALLEESLAICRELGDKHGIARSLRSLGQVAYEQGEYGAARARWEESLALFREVGNKPDIAIALGDLGTAAHARGEYWAARALFEESLVIYRELGHKRGIAANLEGLAGVAVTQAQPERAARLLGAAEGLREAMGTPRPPTDRAEHERSVVAARTGLSEEAFTAAWAEGRAMSLDDAVRCALEVANA